MPHAFAQTVAILFGGRSSEHEISLRSAIFILKNMPQNYSMILVGISREGSFFSIDGTFNSKELHEVTTADLATIIAGGVPAVLGKRENKKSILLPLRKVEIEKNSSAFFSASMRILNLEASCIFPVLHGPNGEDGRLQGLFELAECAYVGCDLRASVVGIDKDIQKRLVRATGVAVAKYEVVELEEFENQKEKVLNRIEGILGFPCFVKPNSLGSAVGTGKALSQGDLERLLLEAFAFDQKALVEEMLVGSEVECAFLGTAFEPRITGAGEIATSDFYSYEEKYADSSTAKLFIPARLLPEQMQVLKEEAKKVAKATGIEGLCRIDFWYCKDRAGFVFSEINTLPGLTSISMFPKLWEHEGIIGKVWIEELIVRAYERQKHTSRMQYGIKAS